MNTLLTIAAANGVLPDLLPKIQPLRITAEVPSNQEVEHHITAAPMQSAASRQHEQMPHMVPTNPHHTHTTVPKHIAAYETIAERQSIVQPIVISPGLQTNPVAQQNPYIPRNPESLQPQLIVQPKEELCFCSEHTAASAQIQPPPSLPMAGVLNTFHNTRLNLEPQCANSILTTENGFQYPVNLQISIPPPNVEAPRITFINAALPTPSIGSYASTDTNTVHCNSWSPYGYTPQPQPQQVIVRKRKSSFKDWLPLIIYSMFHNDQGSCNNGGCCCQCESRSGTVPIPYPIPIPTNNPIITARHSFPNSSRYCGSKQDGYDD